MTKTKVRITPDSTITVSDECPGCGEYPRWNGSQHCKECAAHWDETMALVRRDLLSLPNLLQAVKEYRDTMEVRYFTDEWEMKRRKVLSNLEEAISHAEAANDQA